MHIFESYRKSTDYLLDQVEAAGVDKAKNDGTTLTHKVHIDVDSFSVIDEDVDGFYVGHFECEFDG